MIVKIFIINMNTQNILKYFGSKLDVKLDGSEYYDYELGNNQDDFDSDVLDFNTPIVYSGLTIDSNCLYTPLNDIKPWNIEINVPYTDDNCDFTVRRRTEKGWTLDFVFNKDGKDWVDGKTFYYWGIKDELNPINFVDNNLSFSFTSDGKIMWEAYRYSGYCDSGYTESYYTSSGQTPTLCPNGTSNDFNITIVFDRYKHFYEYDLENVGGVNDYITGWTVTNVLDIVSGATEQISGFTETLSKQWSEEQNSRLGTLKIYLNGNPIYKVENWEEVIPSPRNSYNGIFQIWGGGTSGYVTSYSGDTSFILKQIQYIEEPLNFVHVKHHYLSEIKSNYVNIVECQSVCADDLYGYNINMILTEGGDYITTEDNIILLY